MDIVAFLASFFGRCVCSPWGPLLFILDYVVQYYVVGFIVKHTETHVNCTFLFFFVTWQEKGASVSVVTCEFVYEVWYQNGTLCYIKGPVSQQLVLCWCCSVFLGRPPGYIKLSGRGSTEKLIGWRKSHTNKNTVGKNTSLYESHLLCARGERWSIGYVRMYCCVGCEIDWFCLSVLFALDVSGPSCGSSPSFLLHQSPPSSLNTLVL